MLMSIMKDKSFLSLKKEFENCSHAYLFYSKDKALNNNIAELFAMSIFCGSFPPCTQCDACKRTILGKNPDLILLDKPNIVVDDIANLLDNVDLKPMIYPYKIVIIKNSENINEIAQNKLLKTLEEPNNSLKFILTTTQEEKLLPTVRSRLKKVFLSLDNIEVLRQELLSQGVKEQFVNDSFTIDEMIANSHDKDYINLFNGVEFLITNLKTTQDIPRVVNGLKLGANNKFVYLDILNKLFDSRVTGNTIFSEEVEKIINKEYPLKLVVKVKVLLEDAYKKLKSNVNANYVYDNLLYKILKEKYLCKL